MFGERGWRTAWVIVQSRRCCLQEFGWMISIMLSLFVKLYRVLWALLSNIFRDVKAVAATRTEMSVKPHRAAFCSPWVVAGHFLSLMKGFLQRWNALTGILSNTLMVMGITGVQLCFCLHSRKKHPSAVTRGTYWNQRCATWRGLKELQKWGKS